MNLDNLINDLQLRMFNTSSSALSDRKDLDPAQALLLMHNWDVNFPVSELPQIFVPVASLAIASHFGIFLRLSKELNVWRFLFFLDGLSRCVLGGTSHFAG